MTGQTDHHIMNLKNEQENQIEELLVRMTLAEKVGQLNLLPSIKFDSEEGLDLIRKGMVGGIIMAATAHAGSEFQQTASFSERNKMQHVAVEQSRLGIPLIFGRDIIHGYRTVFPIPLAQAASWDRELVRKAALVSAIEAASDGIHWTFAPAVDIARDPRWGRIIEGYGEDPYLSAEMARYTVLGFQGEDLVGHLAACAKHYIGYGASEGGRDYNSTEISEYTIRNFHLKPFAAAVSAGVCTVMSSFNDVSGNPVTSNSQLLSDILKQELEFKGFVVSDWGAIAQLMTQGTAVDRKSATRKAFNAGVDMDMNDRCFEQNIISLVQEGSVDARRLDDAVRRILRVKIKLGLFKAPFAKKNSSSSIMLHPDHIACSRKLAASGMVLLKNADNILPLPKRGLKIAVIGPFADERRSILGSWTLDGRAEDAVSIVEGITSAAPAAEILTAPASQFDEMISIARLADIVILALGESWSRTGEGQSVAEIKLPAGQEELLAAISKLNGNIIVVICAGRPLSLMNIDNQVKAILYAWHSGLQTGHAVADIIFGDLNPSGRLPVTFPRHSGQIPLYYNHRRACRSIDEYYGVNEYYNYHDLPGSPQYPFGFGLSYSEFQYGAIMLDKPEIRLGDKLIVCVKVTNTSKRPGDEIIQCYIEAQHSNLIRPVRELVDFRKISLQPDESCIVSFTLDEGNLSYYGCDNRLILEPGLFSVYVGCSCLTKNTAIFRINQ